MPQPDGTPWRLLGVTALAREFKVGVTTVKRWRDRPTLGGTPFPPPDAVITNENGYEVAGWDPARLPEIRAWRDAQPGKGWRAGEAKTPAERGISA